jgi:hypothetical protein
VYFLISSSIVQRKEGIDCCVEKGIYCRIKEGLHLLLHLRLGWGEMNDFLALELHYAFRAAKPLYASGRFLKTFEKPPSARAIIITSNKYINFSVDPEDNEFK